MTSRITDTDRTGGAMEIDVQRGKKIVAMCEHLGSLYVATERTVYKVIDGELVPLCMVEKKNKRTTKEQR